MDIIIRYPQIIQEKSKLEESLWTVLWKPIGLDKNVREKFKLIGSEINLIAVESGSIIGALVANRISGDTFELKHIAVLPESQNQGIGKKLISNLEEGIL